MSSETACSSSLAVAPSSMTDSTTAAVESIASLSLAVEQLQHAPVVKGAELAPASAAGSVAAAGTQGPVTVTRSNAFSEFVSYLGQAKLTSSALTYFIDIGRVRTTYPIPPAPAKSKANQGPDAQASILPDLSLPKHAHSGLAATLAAITQAAARDVLRERSEGSSTTTTATTKAADTSGTASTSSAAPSTGSGQESKQKENSTNAPQSRGASVLASTSAVTAEASLASVTSVTCAVPALPWDVAQNGDILKTPSSTATTSHSFPSLQLLSTSRSYSNGAEYDIPIVYAMLPSLQTRITAEALPITVNGNNSRQFPSLLGDGIETQDLSLAVTNYTTVMETYSKLYFARLARLYSTLLAIPWPSSSSTTAANAVSGETANPKSSFDVVKLINMLHKLVAHHLEHTPAVSLAKDMFPSRADVEAVVNAAKTPAVQESAQSLGDCQTASIFLALLVALEDYMTDNPLDLHRPHDFISNPGLEVRLEATQTEPSLLIAYLVQTLLYADRAHMPSAQRPPMATGFSRCSHLDRLWWKRQLWLGLLHIAAAPLPGEGPVVKSKPLAEALPQIIAMTILAQYYACTSGHAVSFGVPMSVHNRPDYDDDAPNVDDPFSEKNIEAAKPTLYELSTTAAEAGAVVDLVQFMMHPFALPIYEDAARGVLGAPHSSLGFEPIRQPTQESFLCRDTLDGLALWVEDTAGIVDILESDEEAPSEASSGNPELQEHLNIPQSPVLEYHMPIGATSPGGSKRKKPESAPKDPHRPQSLTVAMLAASYHNASARALLTSGQNPSIWITQRGIARAKYFYSSMNALVMGTNIPSSSAGMAVASVETKANEVPIFRALRAFAQVGIANVASEDSRHLATDPPANSMAAMACTPAEIAQILEASARMSGDAAASQSNLSTWLRAKTRFETVVKSLRELVLEYPEPEAQNALTQNKQSDPDASPLDRAANLVQTGALGCAYHLLGLWNRRRGMYSLFKIPRSTSRALKRFHDSALLGCVDGIVSLAETYAFASPPDPELPESERNRAQEEAAESGAAWYIIATERYNDPEAWLALSALANSGHGLRRMAKSVLAHCNSYTPAISTMLEEAFNSPNAGTYNAVLETPLVTAWAARFADSCALRAALLGHPIAQYNYAVVLTNGMYNFALAAGSGAPRAPVQANPSSISANNGSSSDAEASRKPGLVIPAQSLKDERASALWYARSAIQGAYVPAMVALAVALEDGRAILGDDAAAARWYRAGALCGRAEAQYNLGLSYLHKRGISSPYTSTQLAEAIDLAGGISKTPEPRVDNVAMAKYWFKRAAVQGLEKAITKLAQLRANEAVYRASR